MRGEMQLIRMEPSAASGLGPRSQLKRRGRSSLAPNSNESTPGTSHCRDDAGPLQVRPRMSNARCRRPDGELQKNKTPLGRRRGLVARWDDRTKLVYAVVYRERRRRANARRPPQAAISRGPINAT